MLPVSYPPCPASMTTRESFRPRLRTRERVPELGAFAGVMGFASPSGRGRCEAAGEGPASADLSGVFIAVAAFAGSAAVAARTSPPPPFPPSDPPPPHGDASPPTSFPTTSLIKLSRSPHRQ